MQVLELFDKIKEQISEEDYNELYELVTGLRDELKETKEELNNLEQDNFDLRYDKEDLQREITSLECQLEESSSPVLDELVGEILDEHFMQYPHQRYDTFEKVIDALDFAKRYC